jgi:hypothetical protein
MQHSFVLILSLEAYNQLQGHLLKAYPNWKIEREIRSILNKKMQLKLN